MSKVDAQRALRDARYARFAAAKRAEEAAATTATRKPAKKVEAPALETPADEAPADEPPGASATVTSIAPPALEEASAGEEELCGHRSMNGRTCTRARGHEQKNHRYN